MGYFSNMVFFIDRCSNGSIVTHPLLQPSPTWCRLHRAVSAAHSLTHCSLLPTPAHSCPLLLTLLLTAPRASGPRPLQRLSNGSLTALYRLYYRAPGPRSSATVRLCLKAQVGGPSVTDL